MQIKSLLYDMDNRAVMDLLSIMYTNNILIVKERVLIDEILIHDQ